MREAPLPAALHEAPRPAAEGKVYELIPVSPSLELALRSTLPAELGLNQAFVPLAWRAPLVFEKVSVGADGADVSTLTVVEMATLLPTLSVPLRVYR